MNADKQEELKKAMIEKGMKAEDAEDVCKAFPFQKSDDGDADDKDDKDDKDKMAKAIEDAGKDPEAIAKAVEKLRAGLDKPTGLTEEEVNDRIEKAVSAVKAPLQQHAVAISQMTDLLLKAHENDMEVIKKSVLGLVDAVKGLAGQQGELTTAIGADSEKIAKAVAKFDGVAGQLEDIQKSVFRPAAEIPRAVQTSAEVIPHASEVGGSAAAPTWTRDEVLKKAVEINKSDADKANAIRMQLMASKPDMVAKQFGLTK
jgi:hypothetical protein